MVVYFIGHIFVVQFSNQLSFQLVPFWWSFSKKNCAGQYTHLWLRVFSVDLKYKWDAVQTLTGSTQSRLTRELTRQEGVISSPAVEWCLIKAQKVVSEPVPITVIKVRIFAVAKVFVTVFVTVFLVVKVFVYLSSLPAWESVCQGLHIHPL